MNVWFLNEKKKILLNKNTTKLKLKKIEWSGACELTMSLEGYWVLSTMTDLLHGEKKIIAWMKTSEVKTTIKIMTLLMIYKIITQLRI